MSTDTSFPKLIIMTVSGHLPAGEPEMFAFDFDDTESDDGPRHIDSIINTLSEMFGDNSRIIMTSCFGGIHCCEGYLEGMPKIKIKTKVADYRKDFV